MANTKELSVEDKLRAIYDLQLIDSRIDEIRNVRGELPLEVEDLEDEVAGLSTRSDKLKSELEVIEDLIKGKRMQLTSTKRLSKSIQNRKLYVTENLTL
jgi:predicted  nucleic acid-binding Zn-ribbon protein